MYTSDEKANITCSKCESEMRKEKGFMKVLQQLLKTVTLFRLNGPAHQHDHCKRQQLYWHYTVHKLKIVKKSSITSARFDTFNVLTKPRLVVLMNFATLRTGNNCLPLVDLL